MPILIRPAGETDLSNASLHPDAALPQTIGGLSAGDWEVGRVTWAEAPVTVTAAGGTGPLLLLVAGQSNSRVAGNSGATPPAKYTDGSLGDVSILVKGTGIADATFAPYDVTANADPDNSGTAWGSEPEFIHRMRQAGDSRPVLVVKESQNGQNLYEQWHPDTAGDNFADLEAKVARARALVPDGFGAEVVIWNQGEADANDGAGPTGTAHTDYAANLADWFAALRARVSASAFVIVQRIRPLGYEGASVTDNSNGFLRAWTVREAQVAVPLADGNATAIDTDFIPSNFNSIHPGEPWTEGMGARSYAAWAGTYDATYGAITDAQPDVFDFADLTDVATGSTVASSPVLIAGIERRAPVSVTGGEWRTLNSLDGDFVVQDWTAGAGFVDKFQRIQVRQTASGSASTTSTLTLDVGGVAVDWAVTTAAGAVSYEPETDAFLAQVQANGGAAITGAKAGALDAFYVAAKGTTWWPKLLRLYARLEDGTSSLLDLRDQATSAVLVAPSGSPYAWSRALGWAPVDNANTGIDLKVDPSTQLPQDGATVGVFYGRMASNTRGDLNGAGDTFLRATTGGAARYLLNSSGNSNASGLTTTPGLRAVVRSGASALALHGPDGSVIATSINASVPPVGTALVLGNAAAGNLGGGIHSDAAFLGAFAAGAALSEGEMQDVAARMATLHTAFAP